ncbi:MAG: NADH-quinone oxidoreductase subunit NuoK [Candidatus Zixiibacteriota bacterium]|nr:MAG: NADH-quinone oxidoreductase subunit NuoK [candidate division Zixibacteria bacterium HGW-Zixibacteria-1]
MGSYIALAGVLFAIGIFGVLTRRNAIGILMSLELMFNAVNINFVAFNKYIATCNGTLTGQIFAIFVVVVAAAEAVVGLAIVLLIYRNWKGIEVDRINVMKW